MKKFNSGFTLIEILIAMAVLGILTVVSLPHFKSQLERSKVNEILVFVSEHQNNINEFVSMKNRVPTMFEKPYRKELGNFTIGTYVQVHGSGVYRLDVVYEPTANERHFFYYKAKAGSGKLEGHTKWSCDSSSYINGKNYSSSRLAPSICRG